jgi:hypothetical protein
MRCQPVSLGWLICLKILDIGNHHLFHRDQFEKVEEESAYLNVVKIQYENLYDMVVDI